MHVVLAASAEVDQPWVVEAAVRLAVAAGATVAVVSVDEVELERLAAAPRRLSSERAERAASTAVERLTAAGVTATGVVLSGPARVRVLEYADDQQADLIVVGSSGRPALATRLLGSVPLSLVSRSSRPVLVVPPPAGAQL